MSELSVASFQPNSENLMPSQNFHQEKTLGRDVDRNRKNSSYKNGKDNNEFKKMLQEQNE